MTPRMTPRPRAGVKRLDDREQRYAYVGAALAVAVSVALWATSFDTSSALALAGIGLVMAALLGGAASRRNRLLTVLASVLLAFGPWGMAWVAGLPFIVLAARLALRSAVLEPRPEPEVDERGDIVTRSRSRSRPPRAPRQSGGRRRRRRSGGADDDDDAMAAASGATARRPGPPPSKRYTPPQRRR